MLKPLVLMVVMALTSSVVSTTSESYLEPIRRKAAVKADEANNVFGSVEDATFLQNAIIGKDSSGEGMMCLMSDACEGLRDTRLWYMEEDLRLPEPLPPPNSYWNDLRESQSINLDKETWSATGASAELFDTLRKDHRISESPIISITESEHTDTFERLGNDLRDDDVADDGVVGGDPVDLAKGARGPSHSGEQQRIINWTERETMLQTYERAREIFQMAHGNPRCQTVLLEAFNKSIEYRGRARDSFFPLVNRCPVKNSGHGKKKTSKRKRRGRRENKKYAPIKTNSVVFAIMMHEEAESVIQSARKLVDIEGMDNKVLIHVDKSSPNHVHEAIRHYCDGHQALAKVEAPVDVEWGELNYVDAQLEAMREADERWAGWGTIVFLSGSDIPLGSDELFEEFFLRYVGSSFFNEHDVEADTWFLMLNDLVAACDKFSVSLGWRGNKTSGSEISREHLSSKGGRLEMGNVHAFMSRQFVDYVLQGKDPNMPILRDALQFVQSADEVFWPTLFFNSPLCHSNAHLRHGREFFLYFWPANPAKTGEAHLQLSGKVCRKFNFSDPDWFCGLSPFWLQETDIPRLSMYADTLFVRKADMRHSAEVIHQVDLWRRAGAMPTLLAGSWHVQLVSYNRLCFVLLSESPPSFQWRIDGCKDKRSLILPKCTGPVSKKAKSPELYSMSGVANQESICLLTSSHFTRACISTRYYHHSPGIQVGFGLCSEFHENQVYRLLGRRIQLASAVAERSYGRGLEAGLCLARSRDGNALGLEHCQDLVSLPMPPISIDLRLTYRQ